MASAEQSRSGGADPLARLVAEQGSGAHPYARLVDQGPEAARNLADAVHLIAMVHGRYPGLMERADAHIADPASRAWISGAIDCFAAERHLLSRLTAAAGPMPSTPGARESEAALLAQEQALAALSESERRGCAFGAAYALACDWHAVRAVLDAAADRFGLEAPAYAPPPERDAQAPVAELVESTATRRAFFFGAEQLLLQQRGMWDILEARAQARLDR
ncbi:MAG: hypothetical protein ACFBQW_07275 [Sphingomonadaceae bacterium]